MQMCGKDEQIEGKSSKQLLISFRYFIFSRAVINGQLFFKHATGGRHIVSDREKLSTGCLFDSFQSICCWIFHTTPSDNASSGFDGGEHGAGVPNTVGKSFSIENATFGRKVCLVDFSKPLPKRRTVSTSLSLSIARWLSRHKPPVDLITTHLNYF